MSEIKKLKKSDLPPKWRERVQQILKEQGIEVNLQRISYVKTGGPTNLDMKEKVLNAIKLVKEEFEEKKKKVADLEASIVNG